MPLQPEPFRSLAEQLLEALLGQPFAFYLRTGSKLSGVLLAYDAETILFGSGGVQQVAMRDAISTLRPAYEGEPVGKVHGWQQVNMGRGTGTT